jgi:hypothetical protein
MIREGCNVKSCAVVHFIMHSMSTLEMRVLKSKVHSLMVHLFVEFLQSSTYQVRPLIDAYIVSHGDLKDI